MNQGHLFLNAHSRESTEFIVDVASASPPSLVHVFTFYLCFHIFTNCTITQKSTKKCINTIASTLNMFKYNKDAITTDMDSKTPCMECLCDTFYFSRTSLTPQVKFQYATYTYTSTLPPGAQHIEHKHKAHKHIPSS